MRLNSCVLAIAALALSPAAVSAATYSLGGNGGNLGATEVFSAAGAPNITVMAGASGLLNFNEAIFQSPGGLGVVGTPDTQGPQIDGFPVLSAEFLTVTFDWAVNLLAFALADTDNGILGVGADQYDISINGQSFSSGLTALATNLVNRNYVKTFTIRASGSFVGDLDDFKLSAITVAPVPVPAAGLLLVGALGGLAALRRRKTV